MKKQRGRDKCSFPNVVGRKRTEVGRLWRGKRRTIKRRRNSGEAKKREKTQRIQSGTSPYSNRGKCKQKKEPEALIESTHWEVVEKRGFAKQNPENTRGKF